MRLITLIGFGPIITLKEAPLLKLTYNNFLPLFLKCQTDKGNNLVDILGIVVDNFLKPFTPHYVVQGMADEKQEAEKNLEEAKAGVAEAEQGVADANERVSDEAQEVADAAQDVADAAKEEAGE